MGGRELTYKDIQGLNGREAVAAFFTMLGYETSVRVEQSPAALGITADSLASQIRGVELIANQEDLLYVYLFELTSVTLSATRAIARTLRSRAGNYLLVLADDYEEIDFVLLEKSLPLPATPGAVSQKQVGIRPRSLSVNRRKPERIHLRVLRRFAYTEPDPIAQYQKLCSAYTVAEWSEDFFNNRALFSDYFLKERLPEEYTEWREDPLAILREFRALYAPSASRWGGKSGAELQEELLVPAFRLLGYTGVPKKGQNGERPDPDYRLYGPGKQILLALCLTYPWNRSLDGKDPKDPDRPEENPAAIVVSLLQQGETDWAIVTNGKLWRLYSARTHSRATNYYESDLEELLAEHGGLADETGKAFRYFWLCFRREAMEPPTSFLQRLLEGSEDYAKRLGERLKERVFEEIFPHFAAGFIESIRHAEGRETDLLQNRLDQIFQGTLTFLYRLLFLLYAEARDLLPVKETRGYWEKSLTRLKREVRDVAGDLDGENEAKLNAAYRVDSTSLYDRLTDLFRAIDQGEAAINVPMYNGGLFLTAPDPDDTSPEAEIARFILAHKIPDRHLALGLDRLARDVDEKTHALVFIDYKSLGVRQLGSIYEGLLEFKVRVAREKVAVVRGKRTEEVVSYREVTDKKLKILTEGRGKDAKERIYPRGKVYLENDRRERKATGSYYTPDHIVRYIVQHAVGPVLDEKFEATRPLLREAQKLYREAINAKAEFERRRMTPPDPEQRALRAFEEKFRTNLVDEIFNLKVLDPAMGSGHFLVEAVDFITDRMLDFLNAFPWNPVLAQLKRTRETILREMEEQGVSIDQSRLTDVNLLKRHILKRCIYGVDLNPMAVELAKVSLWLDCFTLGAPLSFLDHHLRCGNSLIGVTVKEVQEALEPVDRISTRSKVAASASEWKTKESKAEQWSLFGSRFAGLLLATDLMRHVGELSDVTSAQVQESRAEYRRALDALAPFKRILDVYTSQWFGNGGETKRLGKRSTVVEPPALAFLKARDAESFINARDEKNLSQALGTLPPNDRRVAETALAAAADKWFFHWELEFPEVFYGPRPGTRQTIERLEGAGFDAVIGNPPYDVLASEELGRDVSQDLMFYEATPIYEPAIRGKKNLYKLFTCRGTALTNSDGAFSFIVPMPLLGDDQAAGVRRLLLQKTGLIRIEVFPQKDDPQNRVFPEAKLATCIFVTRAKHTSQRFIVRTHSGHLIDADSPTLEIATPEVLAFDPEIATIPSCTKQDWELVTRLLASERMCRMSGIAKSFQGEVNETNERSKGSLTSSLEAPLALRGANICMYAVREASQGEDVRVDVRKFLRGKGKDAKAFAFEHDRSGFQRSSPQNNFRRIIAARIPKGNFCLDTVSYVTDASSQMDLDLLLALLNSKILDWYFRLGSTNSKVNEYQFNALPVPSLTDQGPKIDWRPLLENGLWKELAERLCNACAEPGVLPKSVAVVLTELSRCIQAIEAKRVLKSRPERARLAPESQPIQDVVDAVLFRCYGFSEEESRYVTQRLSEML